MAGKNNKAKMEKFDTLRSPKGIAGFSYLREPDEGFGQCKHRVQLFPDKNDPEFKTFATKLLELKGRYMKMIGSKKVDKLVPAMKKADAYLAERFKDYGVKEGDVYFEFSSKARQDDGGDWKFVDIFDSKGVAAPELRVFGGDIIRCSVTVMGYKTGENQGVKPYLNAVQVLVKKNGGGGRVNVFTDESAEYPAAEGTATAGEDAPFEAEEAAPKTTKGGKGKTEAKAEEAAEEQGSADVDLDDIL
jgi:hypothetical protein